MPLREKQSKLLSGLPERSYRPELHGVRGLAILGVVLFHLFGDGRVSGGIDIFLAITGFLFTAMLLREAAENGGMIRLGRYFGRLARRIIPPAALVVVVTAVVGYFVLPSTQHHQLFREARASLLYFENFELISSQLSYEAAGPDSSPFQHFWSLSVQGQFYLIWPIVAVLAVLLARVLRRSAAGVMAVFVGLVFAGSFVWAIHMGGVHQEEAYLMTSTRMWELAFGGLLALLGARLTLPRPLRMPAGWAGFALIVLCGFFLDGAELFPGPWALWPLAGLALVLAATRPGETSEQSRFSAARVLSTRPFGWLGGIAYGLYLWHWPVLIFWLQLRDADHVGPRSGTIVLTISLVLAGLTLRFMEKPLAQPKRRGNRLPLALAASALVLGGVGSTALISHTHVDVPEGYAMSSVDRETYPGAAVTLEDAGEAPSDVDFYPSPEVVSGDFPEYRDWGCSQGRGDESHMGEVLVCEDPDEPDDPAATVMLAGGSHAGHWHAAFSVLAEQHDWELLVADKNGCRFGSATDPETDKCHEWQLNFMETLEERQPDLVVTPGTASFGPDHPEHIAKDAPDRWEEIVNSDTELLLLRGITRPASDVPDCLASRSSPEECGPNFGAYQENNPLDMKDMPEGIYVVDMIPHICPDGVCSAVVGNVVVYRDASHLSNQYVETLAPILDSYLRDEAPHLYR
ncbi:acyltransferase family protein [Nesterenkonia populi]|uniref:acyltransferase family protein n=1 Tax=Nesterenkonia populi TaxID=1591087 RepID=UPI001478E99E|nr:acyltransferase family protein [Nesterenkonia populi]